MVEMNLIRKYSLLFVTFSVIHSSFSAIFLTFISTSPSNHFTTSRGASVHRGLLLSLSSAQKNQICFDVFSIKFNLATKVYSGLSVSLLEENQRMKVGDEWLYRSEPVHPVSVKKIRPIGGTYEPFNEDLFFKCVLKNYPGGLSLTESEYHVSSAYHPNLMFDGSRLDRWDLSMKVAMRQFILLSPKFVPLDPVDLESQYVTTRRTLRYLEEESAEYVNLIQKKDTISTLSTWQTFLLCSSIISAPDHEHDRHKFSMKWLEYKQYTERERFSKYENLQISFRNEDYDQEKWMAKCVYCKSSSDTGDVFSGTTTNLIFTRDFSDQNSVYILMEQFGVVHLSEFMKNVPVLMNAHVSATNNPPP